MQVCLQFNENVVTGLKLSFTYVMKGSRFEEYFYYKSFLLFFSHHFIYSTLFQALDTILCGVRDAQSFFFYVVFCRLLFVFSFFFFFSMVLSFCLPLEFNLSTCIFHLFLNIDYGVSSLLKALW